MPKKSIDRGKATLAVPAADKMQSKTERSHEENQERAYIAASRRADRSLEARVQSARMASEIHKKRTGKGFRISEEIVMKEEMYEEEEDEFPRSYRLLGPHMQTSSPEMNFRVEAYLTNKVAMSRLVASTNEEWRQNEINKLFAQSFPNAGRQARQMNQQMSGPVFSDPANQEQSMSRTSLSPRLHQNGAFPSMDQGTLSPAEPAKAEIPESRQDTINPPADSFDPGSATLQDFDHDMSGVSPIHESVAQSAFTAELPAEARMLMTSLATTEPFDQGLYGSEWISSEPFYDTEVMSRGFKIPSYDPEHSQLGEEPGMKWDFGDQPPTMEEPVWDSFLNDNAWVGDQ